MSLDKVRGNLENVVDLVAVRVSLGSCLQLM